MIWQSKAYWELTLEKEVFKKRIILVVCDSLEDYFITGEVYRIYKKNDRDAFRAVKKNNY